MPSKNYFPVLALLAALGCSADYVSGTTKCAAADDACPKGFSCRNGICFSDRAPVGGAGGTGTGGAGGTNPGGAGGTNMGGMGGTPGTGGMGMSDKCPDATKPQYCPAHGGADQSCVPAGSDCNTLIKCPGATTAMVCDPGYVSNCNYVNICGPTSATVCTSDPVFTKYCPAASAQIGPVCVKPTIDCGTLTVCNKEPMACATGMMADPATCKCVASQCTDPNYPTYCAEVPAGFPSMCVPPMIDCTTLTTCGTQPGGCATGGVVDCETGQCVAKTQCPKVADGAVACDVCAASKCCGATGKCLADATCGKCLSDPQAGCTLATGGPLFNAWVQCMQTYCATECQ